MRDTGRPAPRLKLDLPERRARNLHRWLADYEDTVSGVIPDAGELAETVAWLNLRIVACFGRERTAGE